MGKGHEVENDWKNINSLGGSHNTTTTKELVAASTVGDKTKAYSLTLSTLDVTLDNVVQITNGSGGAVLYEIEFGAGVQGVQLPSSLIRYLETTADTALHIKLGVAQKVTYSLSYYQEV